MILIIQSCSNLNFNQNFSICTKNIWWRKASWTHPLTDASDIQPLSNQKVFAEANVCLRQLCTGHFAQNNTCSPSARQKFPLLTGD